MQLQEQEGVLLGLLYSTVTQMQESDLHLRGLPSTWTSLDGQSLHCCCKHVHKLELYSEQCLFYLDRIIAACFAWQNA